MGTGTREGQGVAFMGFVRETNLVRPSVGG